MPKTDGRAAAGELAGRVRAEAEQTLAAFADLAATAADLDQHGAAADLPASLRAGVARVGGLLGEVPALLQRIAGAAADLGSEATR